MQSVQIFVYLQFFTLTFITSSTIHEINQAIFLDPRTHSAVIRCPLDFTHSSDIQWYDVSNRRYESDRGRYYHINGSQPFDREFICSTKSQTGIENGEKYRIKIRTYGNKTPFFNEKIKKILSLDRPLNIRHAFIRNLTNTSITIEWEDDSYNRNANISYYELVLK